MRFEELYARRQRRELTMAEVGEMLGVIEWTFHRWSIRYEGEGGSEVGGSAGGPCFRPCSEL